MLPPRLFCRLIGLRLLTGVSHSENAFVAETWNCASAATVGAGLSQGPTAAFPARSLPFSLDCGFPDFLSTGLVLGMVSILQLELHLAQFLAVPYNHRLTISLHPASSWLLLERGESCWQRLFTLWLPWQGRQLYKGQSCIPQPELGLCPVFRLPGPGTRNRRHGREGRW